MSIATVAESTDALGVNLLSALAPTSVPVDPIEGIAGRVAFAAATKAVKASNEMAKEVVQVLDNDLNFKAAYDQVMQILHDEVPYVYLYHTNNVFAMRANVSGFTYVPDGIIRAANMSKQ